VTTVSADAVRVGDVLCYPGEDRKISAHRVIHVLSPRNFRVRGDNVPTFESVVTGDWVIRVEKVEWRGLSYSCNGPLGRLLAVLAVHRPEGLQSLGRWFRASRLFQWIE
jgi:hypothetical protein